jgi:signal transduction histidine kinase
MLASTLALLPRGYTLDEDDWQRRHRLLLWVLAVHVPLLAAFAVGTARPWTAHAALLAVLGACLGAGYALRRYRRTASIAVTGGLVFCSSALVGLTEGAIEAHFHFFIIIGFIALYQDWVPFLVNVGFTVVSHGIGSAWQGDLIFEHAHGQEDPWLWSLIHGLAVLAACISMMMFWRVTEDQQHARDALARELAEAEIERRRFASELLVNLARRNQSMLQRQMQIINQLEDTEQDPDVLGELFRLDHLTTRVRRNAENLLVLSGEQPPRTWSDPVGLRDVVRAAVAETEDLTRVVIDVDERPAVVGHVVTDLTHLLAELTENAVRFSPPDTSVTVRSRPGRDDAVGHVVVIEDWGVGIAADDLAETNALLAAPPDVDLAVHQRLGFHVVARLAARHGVGVVLQPTPGAGTTAVVTVPRALFVDGPVRPAALPRSAQRLERPDDATAALPAPSADWPGWWEGEAPPGAARPARGAPVATAERPAAPAQRPRPTPAPRAAAEPARTDPVSGLRVRVPQASLAAGLRTAPQAGGVEPARVDPTAASALSRYQAHRQAAHDELDREAGP